MSCVEERVVKSVASDPRKSHFAKLREQLKHLRKAFIDETIVNVDTNIIRILGQVESLSELLEEHGV